MDYSYRGYAQDVQKVNLYVYFPYLGGHHTYTVDSKANDQHNVEPYGQMAFDV
jgi:hypothetical protein